MNLRLKVSLLFLLISSASFGQKGLKLDNPITGAYLKANLTKQHPRLILTPEIERGLKSKLATDPLIQNYYASLKAQSEEILTMPLVERELEGFRLLFVSRELMRRTTTLGLVYRLNGDKRLLDRINAELIAACNFSDWNPEHYLDVAEMAFGVAAAIDWVGQDLPPATIKLAKESLIQKAIMPSYNEGGKRMGWLKGSNNWNTICHAGMIVASLAIAEEDYDLAAKTISRALNDITGSLEAYGPDGVYPEGPSYWEYGTSYGVVASEVLSTALGSDFGISKSPGFMESARFCLLATSPLGLFFNFSDSSDEPNGRAYALLTWFAAKTGDVNYVDSAFFNRPIDTKGGMVSPGLIWLSQFEPKAKSVLPMEWKGDGLNPVAFFRDESNDFFLATKGGRAQVSHANIDAGTFVFDLDGIRWVIDPGNQRYYLLNKIGFELSNFSQNSERWTLLTKNNTTHSTISVNDERFRVEKFAPITKFEKGLVQIDLSPVLEGQVETMHRTFIKESSRSFRIEDEFEINDSTKYLRWAIMTTAEVETIKGGAILHQDGKELRLSILSSDSLNVSLTSFDPPPLAIDKVIPNLKRVEVLIPAYAILDKKGKLVVRFSGD